MNIFVLDNDHQKSVEYLVKKHVTKMPLETTQILCSAFEKGVAPYKKTHFNHPSCIWSRESKQNYEWLLSYGNSIFNEFEYRRGKPHKSKAVLEWCKENYYKLKLPDIGLTPFAQVIQEQYKGKDAVLAYRKYYMNEKRHLADWEQRNVPNWYK